MKKRTYFLPFFWLCLFCFGYALKGQPITSKNADGFFDFENTKIKSKIVGQWVVYISAANTATALCNTCPKLIFKEHSIAFMIFTNGVQQQMTWELDKDKLKLSYPDDAKLRIFTDIEYQLKVEEKKDYLQLLVSGVNDKRVYTLRR